MWVSFVCPRCHSRMTMEALEFKGCFYSENRTPYNHLRDEWTSWDYHSLIQVLYKCWNKDCNSLIFWEYFDEEWNYPKRYYPSLPESFDFSWYPSLVEKLPEFTRIFNQAFRAEAEWYDLIAWPWYRKAIEYLVKDYLIYSIPDKENKDKIPKMSIMDCINNYIDNEELKNLSKQAFWLWNDQVHYYQKREDKDLQYLKKIIITLINYIEMKLNISSFSKDFS